MRRPIITADRSGIQGNPTVNRLTLALTPEQLAADYEQKLHAARVAQNGNYYGLKGMAGDLPLEVCLWTFDGMHGVASIVGRTGHPALQGIVDSLEFYK